MAASVTTSLPLWLTGCTYDANAGNDLRNSHVSATWLDTGAISGSTIAVRSGVCGGAGLGVKTASGMNVTVGPGSYVVAVTGSPASGGYQSTLPSSATLSIQTADPANPRIDIVVAGVTDAGGATSSGWVQVITGTAAASPAAPAAPANSIVLARVSVAKGATSIAAGNITDTRPYTTAAGGILKAAAGSVAGYAGQLAFDPATGRFYHNNSSGAQQPHVLPFTPVQAANHTTGDVNLGHANAQTTVCSVTFTTDGQTDIKVTSSDAGTYCNVPLNTAGLAYWVYKHWILDGTTVFGYNTPPQPNGGGQSYALGGGSTVFYSGSGTSGMFGTPSAGTHTLTFAATEYGAIPSGWNAYLNLPGTLRVEPVVL